MKLKSENGTQKVVKTKRSLEHKLTKEELLAYSKDLSTCLSDEKRQEDSLESFKSQSTSKLKELDGRISLLSEKIYSEKEYRETDCEWCYDFAKGEKTLFRLDTGVEVTTEIIAEYEKQEEMALTK